MTSLIRAIALRVAGERVADTQSLATVSAPPPSSNSKLPLPFVLPQQSYDPDSPFVRGYTSALGELGVDEATFIAFVDNLNVAMVSSPEALMLAAASFASSLIVPGVCTVLGAVVGASAQVQAASDRRKTVDTYLEQVNKEYFGPLGIEALILGTDQLHELLRLPLPGSDIPAKKQPSNVDTDGNASSARPASDADTSLPGGVERLGPYATLTPTTILEPVLVTYEGRQDQMARSTSKRQARRARKKEKRAAEKMAKGKSKKAEKLHKDALWVSCKEVAFEADQQLVVV